MKKNAEQLRRAYVFLMGHRMEASKHHFLFSFPFCAAPTEPLLCKFADGGQKKRQSQSKYPQNGRPWHREGEVRCDTTHKLQTRHTSYPTNILPLNNRLSLTLALQSLYICFIQSHVFSFYVILFFHVPARVIICENDSEA